MVGNELNLEIRWVTGYEGLYLVDNIGNVISVPKKEGKNIHNKYNILKHSIKNGYEVVGLSKNGKIKTLLVHRIIAKAFIPNPQNYKIVNHKNGIKTDNRISNLEWCTVSQNTRHAYDNNLSDFKNIALKSLSKYNEIQSYKKIILVKGNKEYSFGSTKEASEFLKTKQNEITRAIRKKQRHKGYYVFGEKSKANGEA